METWVCVILENVDMRMKHMKCAASIIKPGLSAVSVYFSINHQFEWQKEPLSMQSYCLKGSCLLVLLTREEESTYFHLCH